MQKTNEGNMVKFQDRLRTLRGNKRQKDVAEDIGGITATSIGYYESGKRKPDIDMLIKLANYYNVSCDYLLGISDIESPDTNIQGIVEETGLSEKAIKKLHDLNVKNYATGNMDTLSLLIEDFDFSYFLSLISGYVVATDSNELSATIGNAKTTIKETDLAKASLQNVMIEIADRIRKEYTSRYETIDERLDNILSEKYIDKAKELYSQGKISLRKYNEACKAYREGNFDFDIYSKKHP